MLAISFFIFLKKKLRNHENKNVLSCEMFAQLGLRKKALELKGWELAMEIYLCVINKC